MGWWGENVPEETLTRDEASRLMRRLFRMLKPYRWRILVAALVLMGQAACLLGGPLLVKYGIDHGLLSNNGKGDPHALNMAVLAYLALGVHRLRVRSRRDHPRRARRRGLPARDAQPPVPPRDGPVARLLRRREDRQDRRPHDLRHRRDAGADLARARALRAERLHLRRRGRDLARDLVAARARRARDRATGLLRQSLVPARVEQGLPRGARPHLDQPVDAAGKPRRRTRRASVRPRGVVRREVQPYERGSVPREHAYGDDLVEVLPDHRVCRGGRHRRYRRLRRLALDPRDHHRRHRRRVRALAQQPVRADQPAEPALQHGAVGRPRR